MNEYGMDYEGMIFRPPSEAYSILLQVTVGCSHNKCTFCEMYKEKRIFKIKSDEQIMKDLAFAAKHHRHIRRLFLCDGDALILPQKRLVHILKEVRRQLPWVERVGTYANTKSIAKKSVEELKELKDLGLSIAYMGLETGDDETLSAIKKGADSARMIDMGTKIRSAGIKLSVTVLLGIAGRERSMVHARETGRVISAIDPEYVGALSLMLTPGTPLYQDHLDGKFPVLEPDELLHELGAMIAATHMTDGLFHSNHASNYLPIRAKLPEEKEETLALINRALEGKVALKPEHLRAL
ncbi:radical sam [Desulfoluna butyratoxydans]|uniref:Radical sam n=2 Tax=Desulfoluna butyratoxydans TaxID=231438 RepID=A0A4U8YLQ3_9BACT|nr:radical sam [Desulfoluna butyratoxydans]